MVTVVLAFDDKPRNHDAISCLSSSGADPVFRAARCWAINDELVARRLKRRYSLNSSHVAAMSQSLLAVAAEDLETFYL